MDAENGYGYGYRQLEIIAGGGESDGSILIIRQLKGFVDKEAEEEHEHEIDDQGYGHLDHIHGQLQYLIAFEAEHQYDGEQQSI